MLRPTIQRNLLATLLLTTAACTQPPAKIDLMGQNNYGRNNSNSYAAISPSTYAAYQPSAGPTSFSAPAYGSTDSTATIQSIGVSDLTPPAKTAPVTTAPFAKGASVTPTAQQPVQPLASDTVNPWTHAPRAATATSDAPQPSAAASNALDDSFHLSPKGEPQAPGKQMVSDVQSSHTPAKSTGLDTIVSNDTDSVVKKTSPAQKPKKAEVASSSSFMWPVNSKKVVSGFGPKGNGKVNDGINIASAAGEPVWAAADGEVVYVGNELQGYGNIVIIKHSGNKTSTYAHLNRYTVDKYDRIKQGDIIGYVGNTGNVKDPQLHFAIRDGKDAVDPMKYLGQSVASLH